ncbi:MAG: M48 family metallopeptidase [Burkholderiaceae bacterium]
MKFENRLPAEGINSATANPLQELTWLLAGGLGAVLVLVFSVSLAAQWIAPRIPYKYEARLAAKFPSFATAPDNPAGRAVQSELQAIADRIAVRLQMPAGMVVRVGYRDEETINAFATIGGQAVFFRGLLARLKSEDALAMVIAHELAHLKYRHASAALGRGVAIGVVLSVVSSNLGSSAAGNVLGTAGMATLLSFNRAQEREADEAALRALHDQYGHVGGAIELFDVMTHLPGAQGDSGTATVELLQTHPLTANRVAMVGQWATANGAAVEGPLKPLPAAIAGLRGAQSSSPVTLTRVAPR